MTTRENSAQLGVRDAWDFYLSQHPHSIPGIIHSAVKDAVTDWLNIHGPGLFERDKGEAITGVDQS